MEQRLSVVTLGVKDFARAVKFYRDGLKWKAAVMDDVAFFQMNGMVLALFPREKLAEDAKAKDDGGKFSGMTLAQNVRSEKEVDAALRAVEKAGGKVAKPAGKTFWGGYSGYFADPDGFLWEVAHNPFWKLDEKGNVVLPKE